MVRALHEAGIEVWLDVVYNHTCEGDARGPTYSYRGIDNADYYLLGPAGAYLDASGCGNAMRAANPAVRGLVLESLRYWTETMRVDGFRFDLASILTRDSAGAINNDDPALIDEISHFGHAHDVDLVAEAWDVRAYQLGHQFPGVFWKQWNGRFRDDVRAFVRGDRGKVADAMRRLYGSDDLFPDTIYHANRPSQSVNFVTSHDGFSLYDLVAYDRKHNEANGHGNADGTDENFSWNCGWEGDDGAPEAVLALRRRQARNFFALLLLANGTPMFPAGDEFLHTRRGNNNPYTQDNELNWLDWGLAERNRDMVRFVSRLIAFRKAHPSISRGRFWRGDVTWYGVGPAPDLAYDSHSFAYCLRGASRGDTDLYVMVNAWREALTFEVQEGAAGAWARAVDTSRPSPEDIADPGDEVPLDGSQCVVQARSVVVLVRIS
jgi:glycogen operon protein